MNQTSTPSLLHQLQALARRELIQEPMPTLKQGGLLPLLAQLSNPGLMSAARLGPTRACLESVGQQGVGHHARPCGSEAAQGP